MSNLRRDPRKRKRIKTEADAVVAKKRGVEHPYIFEAKLANAAQFMKLFVGLEKNVEECNFLFTSTSLIIKTMDTASVCFIEIVLRQSYFEKYRCERRIACGLELSTLIKFIKNIPDHASATFCMKRSNENKLIMKTHADEKLNYNETMGLFKVNLIECLSPEIIATDCADPDMLIATSAKTMTKIFSSLADISKNFVTLSTQSDVPSLLISVETDEQKGDVALLGSDKTKIRSKCAEPVQEYTKKFSAKYINMFTKNYDLTKYVFVLLAGHNPLRFLYILDEDSEDEHFERLGAEIDDMGGKTSVKHDTSNSSYIRYYLAPMISEDDSSDEDDDDGAYVDM